MIGSEGTSNIVSTRARVIRDMKQADLTFPLVHWKEMMLLEESSMIVSLLAWRHLLPPERMHRCLPKVFLILSVASFYCIDISCQHFPYRE